MAEEGLISHYTFAQFKATTSNVNEEKVTKVLNRALIHQPELAVLVSDLTFVRVNGKWHYVCLFLNLFNREIIGHSAGANKTVALVYSTISSIKRPLHLIELFHTDRGSEFNN